MVLSWLTVHLQSITLKVSQILAKIMFTIRKKNTKVTSNFHVTKFTVLFSVLGSFPPLDLLSSLGCQDI